MQLSGHLCKCVSIHPQLLLLLCPTLWVLRVCGAVSMGCFRRAIASCFLVPVLLGQYCPACSQQHVMWCPGFSSCTKVLWSCTHWWGEMVGGGLECIVNRYVWKQSLLERWQIWEHPELVCMLVPFDLLPLTAGPEAGTACSADGGSCKWGIGKLEGDFWREGLFPAGRWGRRKT